MKEMVRKCQYCKQTIYVKKELGTFIIDDHNNCFHIDCFIKRHKNLKRGAWTEDQCNNKISEFISKTQQKIEDKIKKRQETELKKEQAELKKEQKAKDKIQRQQENQLKAEEKRKHRIERDELYTWLGNAYEITLFPQSFYAKMEQIFNGTYRSITRPVLVSDLLDMWKQKINYLNKVNLNNKKNGKKIIGINRINYDLAIVLSKYDSYLAWKKEKEIEREEIQKQINNQCEKIDYDNSTIKNKIKNNQDKEIDIANIIDEI